MYNQWTSIGISVFLFVFTLIAFVAQTAGLRAYHYDFIAFDDPGIEMMVVEIFALFYSFTFVLWQTQLSHFFLRNSEDTYRLIIGLCLALGLIWCCALISSLVAYTYNALLLFLLVANTIQSLLVPYALFQLKSQHDQISSSPLRQQDQIQEQAKLLEELRIIRQKLEQNEHQFVAPKEESTTFSNQPSIDLDLNPRVTRVSFADQHPTYITPYRYYP